MSGHTPGPWLVEKITSDSYYITISPEPYGPAVAWLVAWLSEGAPDVSEANAHLISAAPDLLEALQKLHAFVEEEAEQRASAGSTMSDYEREPRELAEIALAAIQKATGGRG